MTNEHRRLDEARTGQLDRYQERAFHLLTSDVTRRAFDIRAASALTYSVKAPEGISLSFLSRPDRG